MVTRHLSASTAALTMIVSGLIIACFLIFHLLHFTAQVIHPERQGWHDALGRHDAYSLVIVGFRDPFATGFYLLGLFLLSMHLGHGIQSFISTLGVRSRKIAEPISTASPYLAGLIFLGYASVPIASILRLINPIGHYTMGNLDSKIPSGPLQKKWSEHKFESKLINPANRRKYTIIVVGSGLAGASAASGMGEMGYSL